MCSALIKHRKLFQFGCFFEIKPIIGLRPSKRDDIKDSRLPPRSLAHKSILGDEQGAAFRNSSVTASSHLKIKYVSCLQKQGYRLYNPNCTHSPTMPFNRELEFSTQAPDSE
jgi:hypothetical protein